MKKTLECLALLIIIQSSPYCFADNAINSKNIVNNRNQLDDSYIGAKLDKLENHISNDEISIIYFNENEKIILDKNNFQAYVFKDKKENLNKIKAWIEFSSYQKNEKIRSSDYLYLQCPLIETKQIIIQRPIEKRVFLGKEFLYDSTDVQRISTKLISPGFYSFSFNPKVEYAITDNESTTDESIAMGGMRLICMNLEIGFIKQSINNKRKIINNKRKDNKSNDEIIKNFGMNE